MDPEVKNYLSLKKLHVLIFFKGYFVSPAGFYGPSDHGVSDLSEQEGFNGYPVRGNRGFRGGRGRGGGQRGRITKTEKFVFKKE